MSSVSLYFKVHIAHGLSPYTPVSIGTGSAYFNQEADKAAVNHLADDCYLPTNTIIASLIKKHNGKFKLTYSISGSTIDLLMQYRPDVIISFQQLAKTGCVEFLAETYYNSLSWLHSKKEFAQQVYIHAEKIKELFGLNPVIFRNTELIYNNELADFVSKMGYKGIICEGLERILQGRSTNQMYKSPGDEGISVLLRNVSLSDDIAFRFDDKEWNQFHLTSEKYAGWIHEHTNTCNINILIDYETFGIHKKKDTGIFEFLENLPRAILSNDQWDFTMPSELLQNCSPADVYDVPDTISWKDKEVECCVWCENTRQNNMLKKIYSLENMVHKNGDEAAIQFWRQLQSADYFYHMSGESRTPDDAYQYLNPFASAEEAHNAYINILTDFEIRLIEKGLSKFKEANQSNHQSTNTSIF